MNVLVITADDIPQLFHEVYGADALNVAMPTVDALAADGLTFPLAVVQTACTATRISLSTGRYPHRTGAIGGSYSPAAQPHVISAYRESHPTAFTALVGKGGGVAGTGTNPQMESVGLRRYLGNHTNFPGGAGGSYNNSSGSDYDETRTPTRTVTHDWATSTHLTTNTVTDFETLLAERRSGYLRDPWFIWLSFNAPHGDSNGWHDPAEAPGPTAWTTCPLAGDEDCVAAMVDDPTRGLDAAIGDALAALSWHERRNLCIVYTADNGAEGDFWPEYPITRVKNTPYDLAFRVGHVISGACVAEHNRGQVADAAIDVVDLMPTLAELAEFDVPAGYTYDGSSYASLLSADCAGGACDDAPGRTMNFGQAGSGTGTYYRAAYDDLSYSLVIKYDGTEAELYELVSDRSEQTDLCAGDCADTTALTVGEETACQALVDALVTIGMLSSAIDCNEGIAPLSPTALDCTPGDTEFTCTWTDSASADVASHEGRYDCGSGFTSWGTQTSPWNVTGRTNDVACDVEVRAVDGHSNVSTAATDTVTPTAGGGFAELNSCTDGVDCFCDTYSYGGAGALALCDDWDLPALRDPAVSPNAASGPAGVRGDYNFANNVWFDNYGHGGQTTWHYDLPGKAAAAEPHTDQCVGVGDPYPDCNGSGSSTRAIPRHGPACDAPGGDNSCGKAIWARSPAGIADIWDCPRVPNGTDATEAGNHYCEVAVATRSDDVATITNGYANLPLPPGDTGAFLFQHNAKTGFSASLPSGGSEFRGAGHFMSDRIVGGPGGSDHAADIAITEIIAFADNFLDSHANDSQIKENQFEAVNVPDASVNGLGENWSRGMWQLSDANPDLHPFGVKLITFRGGGCATAIATATATIGQMVCQSGGSNLHYAPTNGTGANQYSQSVHWPWGTWACQRSRFRSVGGFIRIEVWLNTATTGGDRKIIDIENIDAAGVTANAGYRKFLDDNYFNESGDACTGAICGLEENTGRGQGNRVIVRGDAPVSCADLNWPY